MSEQTGALAELREAIENRVNSALHWAVALEEIAIRLDLEGKDGQSQAALDTELARVEAIINAALEVIVHARVTGGRKGDFLLRKEDHDRLWDAIAALQTTPDSPPAGSTTPSPSASPSSASTPPSPR